MAKKYLLYIHHPKFELEQHKSKLVNELLEQHYNVYTLEPKAKANVYTTKPAPAKFCKHGKPPEFCRYARAGKPCK